MIMLPGIQFGLTLAVFIKLRREAIEEWMVISSPAAETVAVPFQYQAPIRHRIQRWWFEEIACKEPTSGRQNYLSIGSPGNDGKNKRTY